MKALACIVLLALTVTAQETAHIISLTIETPVYLASEECDTNTGECVITSRTFLSNRIDACWTIGTNYLDDSLLRTNGIIKLQVERTK